MKSNFLKPQLYLFTAFLFFSLIVIRANATDSFPRDVTFNSNTKTSNSVTYVTKVIKAGPHAGKIMMAGEFNTYNDTWWPTNYPRIVRLNTDGTLDKTFRANAFDNGGSVYALAIQADGKVIAGGIFTLNVGGGIKYTNVVRLDLNGNVDQTFNPTGGGTSGDGNGTGWVKDIVIANGADGNPKIWIGGRFESYNGTRVVSTIYTDDNNNSNDRKGGFVVANLNGSIYANPMVEDSPFSTGGGIECMFVTASGQVLIGGEFGRIGIGSGNFTYARRVARMNNNGRIDPSFLQKSDLVDKYVGPGGGVFSIAEQMLISGERKIIIGGTFTTFNDVTDNTNYTTGLNYIARLNENGSLDHSFRANTGTGLSNGRVYAILPDAKGRIIVGGGFTSYNGNVTNRTVRILPDGGFDHDFNIGDGFASTSAVTNPVIYDLAFQASSAGVSEAYILASGEFNYFNGSSDQSNGIRMMHVDVLANSMDNFSVVKLNDSKNKLTWKAMQEATTYIVERSFDGVNFQKIASYYNTNPNSILSHEDIVTSTGKVYYRIRISSSIAMTTEATSAGYSKVVSVNMSSSFSVNLTLVGNELKVYISSNVHLNETFIIQVLTSAGQQVAAKTISMTNKVINGTVWSSQPMKNCLIIVTDSKGVLLKKQMFK
jgi:hypothetical protein